MADDQSGADALRAALPGAKAEVERDRAKRAAEEARAREYAARRAEEHAKRSRKNREAVAAFLGAMARARPKPNPGLERMRWLGDAKLFERDPMGWRIVRFRTGSGLVLDRRGRFHDAYLNQKVPLVFRDPREPETDVTDDLARVLAANGVDLG